MSGTIIMGGFSIGNYKDVPLRVIELLESVSIVAVEWIDPFQDYFKLNNLNPKEVIEYNGLLSNYKELTEYLIDRVERGEDLLFLVDGGMPGISDPGNELAILAKKKNIKVTSIPGPSIVTSVLSICGIDTHRFIFEPEIPEFSEERIKLFKFYKDLPQTIIFIANRNSEASRYKNNVLNENFLLESLEDMKLIFGGHRQMSLCFNITHENELTVHGNINYCISWAKNNKNFGLLTIVVEGYHGIVMI